MNIKRHASVLTLVAAGALALTACGSDANTPAAGNSTAPTNTAKVECGGKKDLVAEGSSAQKGAIEAFTAAYVTECPGQQLGYNASGSGAGVKQFTAGIADFGGSDSALSKDKGEVEAAATRCKGNPAWNLPLVFGPVGIAYKLDGVTDLAVTPEVAAKIFNGGIKKWNDPAVAAVNTGKTLPDLDITVVYRGDESGTTDNFQKYLKAAAKDAWGKEAGKKFNGGVGQGAQGSAGVAETLAAKNGAIGYIELSYIQDKKLSAAKIDSGAGAVALDEKGVAEAIKSVKVKGTGNDLVLDIDSLYASKTAGVYPLVLATYEIVCSKGYDADTAKAVKAYLTVAATKGQAALADAGYVALPNEFQAKILTAIQAIS